MASMSERVAAPEWADFWIAPGSSRLDSRERGDSETPAPTKATTADESANAVVRIDDVESARDLFRSQWHGQEEYGNLEEDGRGISDEDGDEDDEDEDDELDDDEEDDRLAGIDVDGLFSECRAQTLEPGITISERSFEPLLPMEKKTLARCLRMSGFTPPEPHQYFSAGQVRPNGNRHRRLMIETFTNGEGQVNSWKRMPNGLTRKDNEVYKAHFKCLCRLFLPNRPIEWLVTQLTWGKDFLDLESVQRDDDWFKDRTEGEKHCAELRAALFPRADPYELGVAIATYKEFWATESMSMVQPVYFDETVIPNDNVLALAWAIAKMKHFWPLVAPVPDALSVLPYPGPDPALKPAAAAPRTKRKYTSRKAANAGSANVEGEGESESEAAGPKEGDMRKPCGPEACEDLKSKAMRLAFFDGDEDFKLPRWLRKLAGPHEENTVEPKRNRHSEGRQLAMEAASRGALDAATKSASPIGGSPTEEAHVNRATSMPLMPAEYRFQETTGDQEQEKKAADHVEASRSSPMQVDEKTDEGNRHERTSEAPSEVKEAKRGRGRPRKVDADGEPVSKRALAEKQRRLKRERAMALAALAAQGHHDAEDAQTEAMRKRRKRKSASEMAQDRADAKWRNSITGGDEEALAALVYLETAFADLPGVDPSFKFLAGDVMADKFFLLTRKGFFTRAQKFDPYRHIKVDYDGNILAGPRVGEDFEIPQHVLDQLAKWKTEQEGVPDEERKLPKMINPQGRPRHNGTSRMDLYAAHSSTPDVAPGQRSDSVASDTKATETWARKRVKSEETDRTLIQDDDYDDALCVDPDATLTEPEVPLKEPVYETLALKTLSLGEVTVVVGEGKSVAQAKARAQKERHNKTGRKSLGREVGQVADAANVGRAKLAQERDRSTVVKESSSLSPPVSSFAPIASGGQFPDNEKDDKQDLHTSDTAAVCSSMEPSVEVHADAAAAVRQEEAEGAPLFHGEDGSNEDGTEISASTMTGQNKADDGGEVERISAASAAETATIPCSPPSAKALIEVTTSHEDAPSTIVHGPPPVMEDKATAEEHMVSSEPLLEDPPQEPRAVQMVMVPSPQRSSHENEIKSSSLTPSVLGPSVRELSPSEKPTNPNKKKRALENDRLLPILTRSSSPEEHAPAKKMTRRTAGVQILKPPMPSFWQVKQNRQQPPPN